MDQEEIKRKDRDIAERTKKGMKEAFPEPGVNWGDRLKGLIGLEDYNTKQSEALSRRQARTKT